MDAFEKRLGGWWLLLVALTLVSFRGATTLASPALLAAVVLVIAFIKVRIVIHQFMDVRHAPLALRLLLDGWVVIVCAGLVTTIAVT